MNIHTVTYIDQYINNELSSIEADIFEKRLRADVEFKTNYENHLNLIEGMRRAKIKAEILKAKNQFYQQKILKILIIVIGIVLTLISAYFLLNQNEKDEKINPKNEKSIVFQEPEYEVFIIKNKRTVLDKQRTKQFGLDMVKTVADTISLGKQTIEEVKNSFTTIDKLCPNSHIIYIVLENYEYTGYDANALYFEFDDTNFIKVLNQKADCDEKENKERYKAIFQIISESDIMFSDVEEDYSEEENEIKLTTKTSFEDFIYKDKTSQEFYLSNIQKDTILIGKEGTKIKIKKNSFSNTTGSIKIELKEYYELSDILMANLSTHSGYDILETGGMIYLEATDIKTGKRVEPQNAIQISFPTKDQKGMQLFNGRVEGDRMNWELNEEEYLLDELTEPETSKIEFVEEVELEDERSFSLKTVDSYPTLPNCKKSNKIEETQCINNQLLKHLQRKIDFTSLYNSKIRRIKIRFDISSAGRITNVNLSPRNEDAESRIKIALKGFPKFKPATQNGKNVAVRYLIPISINYYDKEYESNSIVQDTFSGNNSSPRKTLTQRKIRKKTQVSSRDLSYRIFSTLRLGWINCDRLINFNGQKLDYVINLEDNKEIDVKLIFKKRKSVLQGRNTTNSINFGALPKDEEVYVVALRKSEEKLEFSIKETTISNSKNMDLEFEILSLSEIRQKLKNVVSRF